MPGGCGEASGEADRWLASQPARLFNAVAEPLRQAAARLSGASLALITGRVHLPNLPRELGISGRSWRAAASGGERRPRLIS